MKVSIWLAAALLLGASGAHADEPKQLNTQQNRMAQCNQQAGDLKGDERRQFMSQCLAGKAKMTPQERMSYCNKQAGDRKGDERKEFMSRCLKG
ncbi:PsiF family protein [Azohydromonas sediminis]|uniref:PsiF family protein n=1 Tax=Azohydromonas sediminis TaxID=2259674 RepID=UPI000E6560A6|nr:PsiF family protein [Azohydromonas sediminis]